MVESGDMKFYIVTPTYNALDWLKRAIRSVADQVREGVEVHHHVQDGASKDGTQAWLEEWQRTHQDTPGYVFTYESCPDKGMYDALNHAWDKMPEDADITAHLNSDEQYLPDALAQVGEVFKKLAEPDMLITTFLFLKEDGRYHCHYRPVKPTAWKCWATSMIRTSACFLNAATFSRVGIRYDISYKIIADRKFYAQYLEKVGRVRTVPALITSTDAITGSNLAWSAGLQGEEDRYTASLPFWIKLVRGAVWRINHVYRRLSDKLHTAPRQFAAYMADDSERTMKTIEKPTCSWSKAK